MIGTLSVAQLAKAVGLSFGLGALLLIILSALPATRSTARQLWALLGSEAVILAAGVLPWFLPPAGIFVCILIMACRVGYESGTVYGSVTGKNLNWPCAGILAVGSMAAWVMSTESLLWSLAVIAALAVAVMGWAAQTSLTGNLGRFAVFPMLPVLAFSHAASHSALVPLLVLAFLLVEIFDSFSLLGGRLYGRTPLVPKLSPRKTWEGLGTGALALAGAILALAFGMGLHLAPMLLTGVTVAAAALAGDLMGSLAKRRAGVKDYPPVMTIQGGVLDITDSWIVAGPSLAALASIMTWLNAQAT